MRTSLKTVVGGVGVLVCALAAASCSATEGDGPVVEDTASSKAALDVASCASATADATSNGSLFSVSPQSYNNCDKAYVADMLGVSSTLNGGQIRVQWADTVPTTQAECEDTEGRAVFYKKNGSQWIPLTGEQRVVGRWLPGPAATCAFPQLFFGPLESGASYRVAGSMRRISGGNPTRILQMAAASSSTKLSAGPWAMCATLFEGTRVRCWGNGVFGRLGYGNSNHIGDDELPSAAGDVDVGGPVFQVASGSGHNCALLKSRNVRCWGNGGWGALGYGNTNHIGDDETPAAAGDVNVGGKVVQLAAGGFHTCALLDTGAVRCWGRGDSGQLGYGNTNSIGDNETPASAGDVNVGGTVTQIVAGDEHTCALLTAGTVRCWGKGANGRLGYANTNNIGDNETPASPGNVRVVESWESVTQLAAGDAHTCAITNSGVVRCWGTGSSGRLGYGNTNTIGDNEIPLAAGNVSVGATTTQISAGTAHTCARLSTGALRCWGFGSQGALGYGNESAVGDNEFPNSVGSINVGDTVRHVAAGGAHTCALLQNGPVKCWGYSHAGVLGLGLGIFPPPQVEPEIGDQSSEVPAQLAKVSLWGGCADGTSEQTFMGDHAVGCAGTVGFSSRQNLCAKGWSVCSANDWTVQRASGVPTHNYWTNDNLGFSGFSSGNCAATMSGTSCGNNPMRICAGDPDPEGNRCNWTHCGLESTAPDQFMGGCFDNTTAGTLCCQGLNATTDGCADGTAEQIFAGGAVGCAGFVGFPDRNALCASGWRACTATEWVTRRDGVAPTYNYWTNDSLNFDGFDTDNCSVSTTSGTFCGATTPMRVCTANGTDEEGNQCNWERCGLNSTTPNDFFGGCSGNTTAGTLCCPM